MPKRGRWRPKKMTRGEKIQKFFSPLFPRVDSYVRLSFQLFLLVWSAVLSVFMVLYVMRFFSYDQPRFIFAQDIVSEDTRSVAQERTEIVYADVQQQSAHERQETVVDAPPETPDDSSEISETSSPLWETEATSPTSVSSSISSSDNIVFSSAEERIREMFFALEYGLYDVFFDQFSSRLRQRLVFARNFNQERLAAFLKAINNSLQVTYVAQEDTTIRYTLSYTYQWQQYIEQRRVQMLPDGSIDLINCDTDGCTFHPFFTFDQ